MNTTQSAANDDRPVEASARLVGDIGGTNARFSMLDSAGVPTDPTTLRVNDYPSLIEALQAYLADQGIDQLDCAAIAMANPVVGDRIKLTNNRWSISIRQTREALGLRKFHVVNDFTALALSLPHLNAEDLVKVGGGEAKPGRTMAVVGPGTGLGVSGLVPGERHWQPLQGEGGHVSVSVRNAREWAVFEILHKKFDHVSAERFLSGPGLVNIYTALCRIERPNDDPPPLKPADISARALAGEDPLCKETLQLFCRLLGSCAGNLVLTLGAEGGVYIGGGIVPRLGDFFSHSGFRQEFENKGRMRTYLERVPSFVIHAPYPALTGAAQLLRGPTPPPMGA